MKISFDAQNVAVIFFQIDRYMVLFPNHESFEFSISRTL